MSAFIAGDVAGQVHILRLEMPATPERLRPGLDPSRG
jgi:hypothetical protein